MNRPVVETGPPYANFPRETFRADGFSAFSVFSLPRAGIKPGDIVLEVDGSKVSAANEFIRIVEERETFSLTVIRKGATLRVDKVETEQT